MTVFCVQYIFDCVGTKKVLLGGVTWGDDGEQVIYHHCTVNIYAAGANAKV